MPFAFISDSKAAINDGMSIPSSALNGRVLKYKKRNVNLKSFKVISA
jgi:hypothetical protein